MALLKPAWMQANLGDTAVEYTAQDDRRVLKALWSREGVLNKDANHLKVSQRGAGANLSVDIAAGDCAIFGDDVSDQGAYQCSSTAVENRATFSTGGAITAPGSGSRTHRVIARIKDKKHNGTWTTYEWVIEILQDTGTGTPATPNSAISLARFTIAAGQVSITNANIVNDDRIRASVGTPWLVGDMLAGGIAAAYGGRDATRPLTWTKNPDGWVFLSGWIRRTAANTATVAGQIYTFDGSATPGLGAALLPAEACPTGIRDISMTTDLGECNLAIFPNGSATFRFQAAKTLVINQTWFSFDGCTFRADAFS